jgi:hypothetical protein
MVSNTQIFSKKIGLNITDKANFFFIMNKLLGKTTTKWKLCSIVYYAKPDTNTVEPV